MTQKKPTQNSRNGAKNRPTGCLIWFIPLTLGLIVLVANPKVMLDIQNFLTPPKSALAPGGKHSGANTGESEKRGKVEIPPDAIYPTPDTSDLRAIITRDMMEQEQILRDLLEKERLIANATNPFAGDNSARERAFSVRVFFIHYDDAGDQFLLKPVNRTLRQGDTPALSTLQALIAGPTTEELRAGYRTLLPKELQIRRMHVDKGVLLIDLSREFLYNHTMGQEGLILQIYQIVNSMTDFSTVEAVRFLIEGQQHATIGGDGIPFDRTFRYNERPLAR